MKYFICTFGLLAIMVSCGAPESAQVEDPNQNPIVLTASAVLTAAAQPTATYADAGGDVIAETLAGATLTALVETPTIRPTTTANPTFTTEPTATQEPTPTDTNTPEPTVTPEPTATSSSDVPAEDQAYYNDLLQRFGKVGEYQLTDTTIEFRNGRVRGDDVRIVTFALGGDDYTYFFEEETADARVAWTEAVGMDMKQRWPQATVEVNLQFHGSAPERGIESECRQFGDPIEGQGYEVTQKLARGLTGPSIEDVAVMCIGR